MEKLTRQDIVDIYINNNWVIKDTVSIEQFEASLPAKLDSLFGVDIAPIKEDHGWFFPVKLDDDNWFFMAFAINNIEKLGKMTPDKMREGVEKIIEDEKLSPNLNVDDIIRGIQECTKNPEIYAVTARIFLIENNLLSDTFSYTFLYNENKSIPRDSVLLQQGEVSCWVYNDEFKKHFDSEVDAEYVQGIISASIAFLLRQFK